MWYSINFKLQAKRLMPPVLTKPKLIAFVQALVSPLQSLNDDFLAYVAKTREDLSYNGQTIMLEKMLNTKYPAASSGIYISHDSVNHPDYYCFYKSELQPGMGDLYFKSEGKPALGYVYFHSEHTRIDFIIKVPSTLSFSHAEMSAWVRRYALAGKKFLIETY